MDNAYRFMSMRHATAVACRWKGRVVPLRLVTLSEQLRRAKKRIAELENAIKEGSVAMREVAFALGVPSSYHRGRADERAAVVGWLKTEMKGSDDPDERVTLYSAAKCVENGEHGEHVKGNKS